MILKNDVIFGKKGDFEKKSTLCHLSYSPHPDCQRVKMKLVKTLTIKDFDLAPNTIDIYYTTRNEQTSKKQYIKMF